MLQVTEMGWLGWVSERGRLSVMVRKWKPRCAVASREYSPRATC